MAKANRKGDGLEYLGLRDGKKWWRSRLYWLDPMTGKEREKQVTFQADTKPLAHTKRAEELEAAKLETPTGRAAKPERKRFSEASASWYATLGAAGTRNVWGSYRKRLDAHFGEWFLDVAHETWVRALRKYFAELKPVNTKRRPNRKTELDPGTVNGVRQVALNIFTHAAEQGWAREVNPVESVKRRSTRLQGLTELGEEPKRSLTEAEAVKHLLDVKEHDPEAFPLITTAYHLGQRFGEVSALELVDLDLATGATKTRRGQYKGELGPTKGKYARLAGMPLELRKLITEHIARVQALGYAGADRLVFPRPPWRGDAKSHYWSGSTLHRVIDRSYVRLGLRGEGVENPVRNTTHTARHTVATIAEGMASEAVLRKVLGQTLEVHRKYKHPGLAQVIELGEAVGSRLKLTRADRR